MKEILETIMTLLQTSTRRANSRAVSLSETLQKLIIPLPSMGHQNGHERAVRDSLLGQISSPNQMGLYAVLRTTRSTRKNGELNAMARYASCMRLALVTAVRVR